MRRVLFLAVCALATAAYGACPQIGIPTLARIQGLVTTTDGAPVENVTVEIYSTKTDETVDEKIASVTTNNKGYFRYKPKMKREKELFELRLVVSGRKLDGVRMEVGGPELSRSEGPKNLLLTVGESKCPDVSLAP